MVKVTLCGYTTALLIYVDNSVSLVSQMWLHLQVYKSQMALLY